MVNQGVYTVEAGHRSRAGGLPFHKKTVHGGREDSSN